MIVFNSDNTIFPYCIFQYMVSSNDRHNISAALRRYSISFSGSQEYTQETTYNFSYLDSFNDFLTHCKWLPTAVFNGYNPGYIYKLMANSEYITNKYVTALMMKTTVALLIC